MNGADLVIGNKNYSSWSMRAWLHLELSGVPFAETRIPLCTPRWDAEIHRYSPSGRVPVLRDGAITVWESTAIMEYVLDTFPRAIGWPLDPAARAVARAVSAEMHAGFLALRTELPFNCRARIAGVSISEAAQRDIARIREVWVGCRERFGAGGPWLFGALSIADVMYAPVALRFVTYGVTVGAAEQSWMEAVQVLPAVRKWCQDAEAETEVVERYTRKSTTSA
ncbi:MAG: glutathione S-transferase family protein [Candidatus Schekmanbacteria bacterium]|nr:glutathione S-transferase family protein [Candidatus Schekmanbacteria bacterium]